MADPIAFFGKTDPASRTQSPASAKAGSDRLAIGRGEAKRGTSIDVPNVPMAALMSALHRLGVAEAQLGAALDAVDIIEDALQDPDHSALRERIEGALEKARLEDVSLLTGGGAERAVSTLDGRSAIVLPVADLRPASLGLDGSDDSIAIEQAQDKITQARGKLSAVAGAVAAQIDLIEALARGTYETLEAETASPAANRFGAALGAPDKAVAVGGRPSSLLALFR